MISLRPLPHNSHYAVPGYSTPFREPMARHAGRDDTLHPAGASTGRDVLNGDVPYNAEPGLFRRLHEGQG